VLSAEAGSLCLGLTVVAWLSLALLRARDLQRTVRAAAIGSLAICYPGLLTACMVALLTLTGPAGAAGPGLAATGLPAFAWGRGALLSLLVFVFFGDTGAYFTGRALGRHPLAPIISPKKTVEGAIGGLIASAGGGLLASALLLPGLGLLSGAGLGLGCGLIGQVGDLVESLFKRACQTKDSGHLLPGHGGVLDRLDGVLFAAPVLLGALWLL
jgi:phosphatidate cytidylyltransferase